MKVMAGGAMGSKTPVTLAGEVLAEILCHNIRVLIQSVYGLGTAALLGPEAFGTKRAVVPEMA